MRAIEYAFRHAWASVWRSRAAALPAVFAIMLATLVLGALLLVTTNVQRLIAAWSDAAEFSVFLRDDVSEAQRTAIEALIDGSGVAIGREYLSKADALGRFSRQFSDLAPLTRELADNPFPASIEVRLRTDPERDPRVATTVARVLAMPGVADVRYDQEWLARLGNAVRAVNRAGLALVVLMAVAGAMTVASVVRLGLQTRRDELEIMHLVGSPLAYIRGPFIAEGVLQGGVGAVLALVLLWIAYAVAKAWWGHDVTSLVDGSALRFLAPGLCLLVAAGGVAVGAAGGFMAARRAV